MSENDNVSVSANNKVPMSTIISGDVWFFILYLVLIYFISINPNCINIKVSNNKIFDMSMKVFR